MNGIDEDAFVAGWIAVIDDDGADSQITFTDWKSIVAAQRQFIDTGGLDAGCPQIFYFEPKKLWCLIFQTIDHTKTPDVQPVLMTSPDLLAMIQPAPRMPQKRSACSSALAVRTSPSAVTISAEMRLSQDSP